MRSSEKAELLKETIVFLYNKEGRSIAYISRLLKINRKTISDKLKKDWKIKPSNSKRHITPSTRKFINRNRDYIKSRLDRDMSLNKMSKELKISRKSLVYTYIKNDDVLNKAYEDYINRRKTRAKDNLSNKLENSSLDYNFEDFDDEIWKPILGYPNYYISNYGRVKSYKKRYKKYALLKPYPNKNNNRLYVRIKNKNLQVSRLVGHAFVKGYSEDKNTINHKDGNVLNNKASNLEWSTQVENNLHAYRSNKRNIVNKKRYKFDCILYKDKYKFKTVAAFARFLNKPETQIRRYLEHPEKHDIKLIINNCND